MTNQSVFILNNSTATVVKLFLVCSAFSLLAGCLSPKNLDAFVTSQYSNEYSSRAKKNPGDISVTSGLANTNGAISTSVKKVSNVLPLIFYWQWNYKVTCTINPQIPINNFTKTVLSHANKGLKQKLNGQILELSVDKIPGIFAINDKAHLVWIVYAFGWDNVSIRPDTGQMVVSYKILQGTVETKKGSITVPNSDMAGNIRMFKSWRKATEDYLYEYNSHITSMSKLVVDKLMKEL